MDTPTIRLLRWEKGETPGPWYVTVFPTNRCNLHCSICWQRAAKVSADAIPDERFLHFVDECADLGVKEWCFAGGGEPIMRAELVMQMCERIRARGMNGVLMSNGIAFKEEYFLRLARVGWSSLVFSMDGHTAEINDAIRSKGAFDHATATIRRMKQAKEEHGFSKPDFSLHATLTSLNYDQLDRLVDLAHELGCQYVGAANLTDANPHCASLRLTDEQRADLPHHVRRASGRAHELGLSDYFDAVLAEPDYYRPKDLRNAEGLLRAMCFEPWLTTIVHADGHVGPCCVYWEETAGNLASSSFQEVWTGPHLQKIREDILAGRLPGFCAKCSPAPPSLGARDELLRGQLNEIKASPPLERLGILQRNAALLQKAVASIRRHGLKRAIQRGKEWVELHRR